MRSEETAESEAPKSSAVAGRGANPEAFPNWLKLLLGIGLSAAVLSVYIPGDWRNGDVDLYHIYALGFWGNLSHPLIPSEYPLLSVFPFGLSLVGPTAWYTDVFAAWMGAIALAGYLAFRRWATPGQAAAYAAYAVGAGIATLLFRYDIVPALLTVGALWLLQRRRFGPAYCLIALATLLKLYPIVLLPVAAIAHWQGTRGSAKWWIRVAAYSLSCLSVIVGVFILAIFVDPNHGLGALTYNVQRPNEVEAVPATLLWLGSFLGWHVHPDFGYGSFNLAGGTGSALDGLADVALAAGVVWTYVRQIRGQLTVGQSATAVVLILLCTNKVLSAQYLLWAAPLLAMTVGFQLRWLFVCLLTAVVFPTLFEIGIHEPSGIPEYNTLLFVGVALRNALLVGVTVVFLTKPGRDLGMRRTTRAGLGARSAQQTA